MFELLFIAILIATFSIYLFVQRDAEKYKEDFAQQKKSADELQTSFRSQVAALSQRHADRQKMDEDIFSVEDTDVPMATLDLGLHFKRVNPAFEALVGWTQEEVEGKESKEILVSETMEELRRRERQVKEGKRPSATWKVVFIHKDKTKGPVRVENTIDIIRDKRTKRAVGFFAVYRDIEKQERLEKRLWHSTTRSGDLFEQTADANIVINLEGTVLAVESSVEEVSGYRPDQIVDRKITDFLPSKTVAIYERFFREKDKIEIPRLTCIYRKATIKRLDGAFVRFATTMRFLHDKKGEKILMISLIDISKHKRQFKKIASLAPELNLQGT